MLCRNAFRQDSLVKLGPLDHLSCIRYTAALLSEELKVPVADAAVPLDLIKVLEVRAAGNPKRTREMLRAVLAVPDAISVLENGRIVVGKDLFTIPVPGRIRGLVMQEFDALEEHQKALLRFAAEFKHGFTADMLASVANDFEPGRHHESNFTFMDEASLTLLRPGVGSTVAHARSPMAVVARSWKTLSARVSCASVPSPISS
jgi:hypothetical protein